MQSKRGQVTLFIIIGVILIAAIGLFLYLRSEAVEKEEVVPSDIAPVKLYVEKCLEETAKDAVLDVAMQGGYFIAPEKSLNILSINIPYYLYEGDVLVPEKKSIEEELLNYVFGAAFLCTELKVFEERGYNITVDFPVVDVTIGEKEVFFEIDFPITIKIEEQEQTISKFSTSVEAELMKLYNAALSYLDYQATEPSMFAISKAMEVSVQNDLTFESFTFEDKNLILSFIDNSTMINNQPLIFSFAIKFISTEEEIDFGPPPEIINETQT